MSNLPTTSHSTEASAALPTVVIGGGIIGLATAYKLLLADRSRRVVVLEKERRSDGTRVVTTAASFTQASTTRRDRSRHGSRSTAFGR